jgi:hypothetical protein
MKIHLTMKDRQALLNAGFPRQTIQKWVKGAKPRIGNLILIRQITGKKFFPGNPSTAPRGKEV